MESKIKTILIYPKLDFIGTQIPTPPYSILFIADYLIKRSVDVKVFDLRYDSLNMLMDEISRSEPEYIGISVMTGPQIYHALNTCNTIKEKFKDIKIVWGGLHSTILPDQTIRNKLIDYIVRGEGEKAFYELVSRKPISDINNLSFKKNGSIFHNPENELLNSSELNELSIPWNLINPKIYIRNGNFTIITSRGCPYKCNFCYNNLLNNYWRGWTSDKVIEELDKAIEYGANKITFFDDNFFANSKRIKPLFNYFKSNDLKWKAELRVDRLNYSLAREAKEHGCSQMYFGVESGSQKILNILNKDISLLDIIRSAKITRDTNIIADYSWMIGIPGESKKDINKTLALIKKVKEINPESEFSVKILFPYPKTKIYDNAVKMGFKSPTTLLGWSKIRREKAPNYLKHPNYLEMISITSAIVGRKVFEQQTVPIFKLIRTPAIIRWKKDIYIAGFENLFFNMFRKFFEKFINKRNSVEYDPFSREFINLNKKKK